MSERQAAAHPSTPTTAARTSNTTTTITTTTTTLRTNNTTTTKPPPSQPQRRERETTVAETRRLVSTEGDPLYLRDAYQLEGDGGMQTIIAWEDLETQKETLKDLAGRVITS